jgi:hypothetical protein
MMSERGFDDLRVGATLSHIAPVRLRVGDGRRSLFEVGPEPPTSAAPCAWLPPCAFRVSVARARQARAAGRAVAVRGLPAGVDPCVELALAPGDEARPGGRLRLRSGDTWRHLFATTLDPLRIPLHPADDVHLHIDGATGVSVLESLTGDEDDDGLVCLLARVAAEEAMTTAATP